MRILDRAALSTVTTRWRQEHGIHLGVETNGRPPWDPGGRIAGVALGGRVNKNEDLTALYIPLAHQVGPNADPLILQDVLSLLDGAPVHAFACATEAMWALARWNLRLRFVGDAYVLARLLSLPELGLKDLSDVHLGGHALHLRELVGEDMDFTQLDSDDPRVLAYTMQGILVNDGLERGLIARVQAANLEAVYQTELRAAALMAQHTLVGYGLDQEVLADAVTTEGDRLVGLSAAIWHELGQINLNSPQQIGAALTKRGIVSPLTTAGGAPSWSQAALEAVQHLHPTIPAIIDWRASNKVRQSLNNFAPEADGRLHPRWQSIGIHGSARMYAEHPPLTSFPPIARAALTPPPGHRWMQVVWDRPELRCLAVLAEDPLLAMVLEAEDFVQAFNNVTGLTVTTAREAQDLLQVHVEAGGMAPQTVFTLSDHAFPQLTQYLRDVAARARETGLITSWMSRQWRLQPCDTPEAMTRRACTSVGRQSVGTALKVALNLLAQERGHPLIRPIWQLLPLFDRVAYVIPEDVPILAHCQEVAQAFTLDLGGHRYPVSMRCGFQTGPTLAALSEVTIQ